MSSTLLKASALYTQTSSLFNFQSTISSKFHTMALDTSVEQQATLLYEKEVQVFLSENLDLLGESGLVLIQTEYPIKFGKDSGRIDVLAKDSKGDFLVIEVKRGVAGRSTVG